MPNFKLILRSLGLAGLKPVAYQLGASEPLQAGSGVSYRFGGATAVADVPYSYPKWEAQAVTTLTGDTSDASAKSWLGTPVFADVRLPRDGKVDLVLTTVLVDVSMTKNVIKTAVQGRNGTIKEYISDGDYEVRLRGAVVRDGEHNYPYDEMRDFHALLSRSEALPVVADYLRLFNIYSLVVTGFKFGQTEGMQNVQTFEIDCVSDTPDDLIEENATADL